jgi:hypothetical protein
VRVFISWSKEPSRSTALALGGWLAGVVQAVEPWVSPEDIRSGMRWREQVADALRVTGFGIICLTRANQHSQWLMFEAGALAQGTNSRIVPLYIDLDADDVTGPLADWQGRNADRDGIWHLVRDINAATPKPVANSSLTKLFERMWPDLESELQIAKSAVV